MNMIKVSDLVHGQTIRLKYDLRHCYEDENYLSKRFTIKANSHLIYDGYKVNRLGIFLKFIHIEECKVVYDLWSDSNALEAIHTSTDKFELI